MFIISTLKKNVTARLRTNQIEIAILRTVSVSALNSFSAALIIFYSSNVNINATNATVLVSKRRAMFRQIITDH